MSPEHPRHVASTAEATVEEVIRERLSAAMGGWRGSIETALPLLVFVMIWTPTKDSRTALIAAGVLIAVLAVARLVQRQTLQFVLSSVFATGLAAWFAMRSGQAEDAFLPGIIGSCAWLVLSLFSVLVKWPVVGFMVGVADPMAKEDPFHWRKDRGIVAVSSRLTLVLVVMYAIRVLIMGPAYLAGNVAVLGVAKVVLGWPLWVAALFVMGLILVRGETPLETHAEPQTSLSEAADEAAEPAGPLERS
ncbi:MULTISPECIES: DUF3159 domain-containing protein [unclassified Janibacter]|uniref:DUF3159 domain-containing protein n=1 Tax=unclassified Janibacter TaxID=2649294 RepID=UPI003CFD1E92